MGSRSVIDKVKALLEKTEGQGCTPEEAASAARVAQQLITQYKLDLAEVKEIGGTIGKHPPLYCDKTIPHWRSDLAHWVSKLNGCIMYRANYSDGTQGIGIIGRKADVRFVRFLFNHCSQEIERMREDNQPELPHVRAQAAFIEKAAREWADSFRHGAVNQIATRMRDAHVDLVDAHYDSTAIVRLQDADQEVHQWANKNLALRQEKRQSHGFNATAYTAGFQAGNRINVGRQLPERPSVDKHSLSD